MPALSLSGCAARRQRLVATQVDARMDGAVLSDIRDIYYFTGTLLPSDLPAALFIATDGDTLLVCPEGHEVEGVRRIVTYEWNHRGTRHPDPVRRFMQAVESVLPTVIRRRVGVQSESLLWPIAQALQQAGVRELAAIDDAVLAMQRRKDPDELEVIRTSIRANLAAYVAVERAIAPGATELEVLSAGRRGAMLAADEKVFHDGDYQCGSYNGPARNRRLVRGELYIVDAWTCYRGYWSDMSRTFVVGTDPSDEQAALIEHIRWLQSEVPGLLSPGVDGTEVYRVLDEMIRRHPPLATQGLIHHGGHAIGLRSHELPDVNLERGGRLEVGNVICIEPGGYFAAARFGVRFENMYLITDDGCEDLCSD